MTVFTSSRKRQHMLASRAAAVLLVLGICSPLASAMDPPVAATHPPVPDTIQQRAMACTSCHGVHGEGAADSVGSPRLAGKPAGYLLQQMRYFQNGQRRNTAMEYVLRQLDLPYMRELAGYFASQQVPYPRPPLPAASAATLRRGEQLALHGDPSRGVPACTRCHGSTLTGVEPMIPGLAGLSAEYLNAQLVSWRTNTRAAKEPFCMGIVANRMRATDVTAVAAWLASRHLPSDMRPQSASAQTEPLPGWCVMGDDGERP
jgi:cytochrome c553